MLCWWLAAQRHAGRPIPCHCALWPCRPLALQPWASPRTHRPALVRHDGPPQPFLAAPGSTVAPPRPGRGAAAGVGVPQGPAPDPFLPLASCPSVCCSTPAAPRRGTPWTAGGVAATDTSCVLAADLLGRGAERLDGGFTTQSWAPAMCCSLKHHAEEGKRGDLLPLIPVSLPMCT